MGRVIGILLFVIALWVGLQIFTEGRDGAFGGAFSAEAGDAAPSAPPTKRAEAAVKRAMQQSEDRVDRALEDAAR